MFRHWEDINNCFILPLTYDIEVIWQKNSKSISQIDSTCIIIHVNLPAGTFSSRFWGSLPSTFKIFRREKKSSTIKSWPTFCDQYFWKFPIWNSRADEKCREIRMVKVNVIFKWYPVIDLFDTFTGKLGHGD